MDQVVIKRKPGRPAKHETPAAESAFLFVIPRKPGTGDEAIDVHSEWTLQHEFRSRLQAELGCNFRMKEGVIGADDGRTLRLAVYPDRIEVSA